MKRLPAFLDIGTKIYCSSIYTYARDVQSAAKNLLAIINDILGLSKVEAGRMELVCTDCYLKALTGEVVGTMDIAASKRGLILKYECDETIPCRCTGDEGRINLNIPWVEPPAVSRGLCGYCEFAYFKRVRYFCFATSFLPFAQISV